MIGTSLKRFVLRWTQPGMPHKEAFEVCVEHVLGHLRHANPRLDKHTARQWAEDEVRSWGNLSREGEGQNGKQDTSGPAKQRATG